VNSKGAFLVSREAARRIPANGGRRIVNITTTVVSTMLHGYAAYSSSKAAVETLTKTLAKEFADEKMEQASQATGEAKESAKETKDTVAAKADSAAY
jgi:3-oxoacyl-[acyl-carrier protein] reductase